MLVERIDFRGWTTAGQHGKHMMMLSSVPDHPNGGRCGTSLVFGIWQPHTDRTHSKTSPMLCVSKRPLQKKMHSSKPSLTQSATDECSTCREEHTGHDSNNSALEADTVASTSSAPICESLFAVAYRCGQNKVLKRRPMSKAALFSRMW